MISTLEKIIERTAACFSFYFKPHDPITWQAGQYMQFVLNHENPDDRGIRRFFTISSAPHEKYIMITTRFDFEKSSTFKKALIKLSEGQNISAFSPQGDFTVNDHKGNYVFIAGGIGITPARSIIVDLDYKKLFSGLNLYLLYSNRDNEIVFKDELDAISAVNNSFKTRYLVSPERCDINLIKATVKNYKSNVYYISGPPGLVKSIEEGLIADGIDISQIKLDYFPGY